MWHTFKPVDHEHCVHEKLRVCAQTGSVIDHAAACCFRLLECTDVSDAEAFTRYINGLKQGTKDSLFIRNPSSLQEVAKWVERYNNKHYSCSRNN